MLPLCQRDFGAPLECVDQPRPSPGSKLWRHQGSTLTMLVCGVAGTRSSVAMAAAAREALYAEVRRCRLQGEQEGGAAASVDYEACLAAFAEDVELG